jgi:hypothetical protein
LAYLAKDPKQYIACKIIEMSRIRRKKYFEDEIKILKEV